jgi:hypothetical protein
VALLDPTIHHVALGTTAGEVFGVVALLRHSDGLFQAALVKSANEAGERAAWLYRVTIVEAINDLVPTTTTTPLPRSGTPAVSPPGQ